jgi:hypothetical protein
MMDEQHREAADDTQPDRQEWVRPAVTRLESRDAELSGGGSGGDIVYS